MSEKRVLLVYGTMRNFKGLRCQKCQRHVADKAILVRTVGDKAVCARCSYGAS